MKKAITAVIAVLLMLANIQTAAAIIPNSEALKDSKPERLSVKDQLYLKTDTIRIGMATAKALVNRLTNKVEYIWSFGYNRYVRPKFAMANAQALYDETRKNR